MCRWVGLRSRPVNHVTRVAHSVLAAHTLNAREIALVCSIHCDVLWQLADGLLGISRRDNPFPIYVSRMSVSQRVKCVTALLLCVGAVRTSHAQRRSSAPCGADVVRQRVCAVDDSLGIALVRADTVAIARLYADDLVSVNYRGVRSTKPMLLAAIGAGRLRFDTLLARSRSLEVYGDTVILLQRMHQVAAGPEGRHPSEVDYRRTYVRRADRWQLAAAVISVPAQQ